MVSSIRMPEVSMSECRSVWIEKPPVYFVTAPPKQRESLPDPQGQRSDRSRLQQALTAMVTSTMALVAVGSLALGAVSVAVLCLLASGAV